MWKLAALIGLVGSAAQAQSEDADAISYCASIGSISELIMNQRQSGTRASVLLAAMAGVDSENPSMSAQQSITQSIILRAYDQPRWNTAANKQRAVVDFAADEEMDCLRSVID